MIKRYLALLLLASLPLAHAITLRHSVSGLSMRGPKASDQWFTALADTVKTITVQGSTASDTYLDRTRVIHTTASYITDYQINVTGQTPSLFGVTFTSLDPSIATVNAIGRVSRVSDGTARILITASTHPHIMKRLDCPVALASGVSAVTYSGFIAGTLGKAATDAIDTPIAANTTKEIYTTQDHATPTYTRNASCWAAGLDLTCVSPWNSTGAQSRAGTLVSPRHFICAEHFPVADGATIRFIKADGTVVTKTVNGHSTIAGTDIRVCVLDSDVAAGIGYAKVLPSGWAAKIPGISQRVPCLVLDQEEKAMVAEVNYDFSGSPAINFAVPISATSRRLALYEDIVSGDSGNPAFMIVGSDLVLLTCWQYGGAGSGPNLAYYKTEINAAMASLGGGYQLSEASMAGLASF